MADFFLVELKTYGTSTSTTTGRVGSGNANQAWASLRVKIVPAKNLKSISFTLKVTSFYTLAANRFTYGLTTNETTTAPSIAYFDETYIPPIPANTSGRSLDVSVTFEGNFQAGVPYFIWLRNNSSSNYAALYHSFAYEIDGESKGAIAYIWTSQEAGAETFVQTVNAGNTFRSLEGYQSSAFVKSSTTGIGGQNIIGIGMNENTGSRLYFNAGCIPVSGVSRRLRSVKISFPVLYNGTGTHNYRWAISTTPPGASSPYINTLSEVTEPGQIASGTFHDYSGSRNEYTFFADIPANTDFYVYLWSHGTEDGVKRYGNFHIQGDISITLTAEAQSGMGWVAFNPYVWQNGAWREMTCNIYKDGSWEA